MDGARRTRRGGLRATALATALLALPTLLPACSSDDDGPTRVLLVGDSLMNQLGTALEDQVGPGAQVRNEAVFGSGLLSPWYFDWPPHLRRVLEDYDPDVVVFLFVGNYDLDTGRYWESADGDVIADPTSREFFTAWRRQAEQMGERAAEDASVAWILPPPMGERKRQPIVEGLREVYAAVADDTGADTIDANDVLADPDGGFLARGRDLQGRSAPLRSFDGVHLAPAGAAVLAADVLESLDL